MSRAVFAAAIAAVAASVVCAGCATAVSGQGRLAASGSSPSSSITTIRPSSASATPTSPTASSSTSFPSQNPSATPTTANLQCTGRPVTAPGAPFCYAVPDGFFDSSTSATIPGSDPYKTAVQLRGTSAGRDLITVIGTRLSVNSDSVPDSELSAAVQQVTSASSNIVGETSTTPVAIASHRGYQTVLTFQDGVQKRFILAFDGYARLEISCQWQHYASRIATGCSQVINTLRVNGA